MRSQPVESETWKEVPHRCCHQKQPRPRVARRAEFAAEHSRSRRSAGRLRQSSFIRKRKNLMVSIISSSETVKTSSAVFAESET